MYIPLTGSKVARAKLEMKGGFGIFFGVNMRTGETIIGTERGTVKNRSINRLAPEERWDSEMLASTKGNPRQPVPGSGTRHIPVRITDAGEPSTKDDEDGGHPMRTKTKRYPRSPTVHGKKIK